MSGAVLAPADVRSLKSRVERVRETGGRGADDTDTGCERCGYRDKAGCSWTMTNGERHWLCRNCSLDVEGSRQRRELGLVPSMGSYG